MSIVSISLALGPAIVAAQDVELQPPALVYPGPARPTLRRPEIKPPEIDPLPLRAPSLDVPATHGRPSLRWKPNAEPRLDPSQHGQVSASEGR
jgi:hypothetical protein